MEIKFLGIDEVIEIHRDQIQRYGGLDGIREPELLESAVAMPMAQFDGVFLHPDLFAMAAAYLFHISQNHPFVDGNKRVATVAALLFLMLNGKEITATEQDLEAMVLSVARGDLGKEGIAAFFVRNTADSV